VVSRIGRVPTGSCSMTVRSNLGSMLMNEGKEWEVYKEGDDEGEKIIMHWRSEEQ